MLKRENSDIFDCIKCVERYSAKRFVNLTFLTAWVI